MIIGCGRRRVGLLGRDCSASLYRGKAAPNPVSRRSRPPSSPTRHTRARQPGSVCVRPAFSVRMGSEAGNPVSLLFPFVAGSGHSSVVHSITRRRLGLAVCHLEWHAPPEPPAALRAPGTNGSSGPSSGGAVDRHPRLTLTRHLARMPRRSGRGGMAYGAPRGSLRPHWVRCKCEDGVQMPGVPRRSTAASAGAHVRLRPSRLEPHPR